MNDQHEEAAEALLDNWLYGSSAEHTVLIQDIAADRRQVERETLELRKIVETRVRMMQKEIDLINERAPGLSNIVRALESHRKALTVALSPIPTANELSTTQELADGYVRVPRGAIIATSVEADFEKGTLTFEPKGQWEVGAGDYYLIPIQAAEKGEE